MNLDKKLAKYARQLDNPKYYGKILKILEKADKTGYQFKKFNNWDLEKITGEIFAYYDAITTEEDDKRMIRYCNKDWFIISDKNYVLFTTPSIFIALSVYIRCYMILHFTFLTRITNPYKFLEAEKVDKKFFMIRGAIKASKFLGTDFFGLDDYFVDQLKD